MSAIIAFRQRRSVHMITDALSYIDGLPCQVDCHKAHQIDGMCAVVSCTGPGGLGVTTAEALADAFDSFDDLIAKGQDLIKSVFLEHINQHRNGDAVALLGLIGWHEHAKEPGLFSMGMGTDGEKSAWSKKVDPANARFEGPRYVLQPFEIIGTPTPTMEQFKAAHYDLLCDFEKIDPETDLLHQIEISRRCFYDGRSYVGGNALLSSVDEHGVTQRIVHTWEEDQPGKPIRPLPIDWNAWVAKRRLAAASIPVGLSRLQRERMKEKVRKGTLRAV